MKTKKVALLVLLILVFFTVKAMAETQEGSEKPLTKEQMNKARERIETLRMWKLTKALDLDAKTSSQLFPLLNRYDKKRAEIKDALMVNMRELRESLRGKNENNVKKIINRIETENNAMQKLKDEEWIELKKVLNIEQQAKYLMFELEFRKEMWHHISEAKYRKAERPQMEKSEMPKQ